MLLDQITDTFGVSAEAFTVFMAFASAQNKKPRWVAADDVANTADRLQAIAKAQVVARKNFGFELKRWQAEAIADAFCKNDIVVSAGTGSGKSVVFQCLPFMVDRGIILVVSPLLSLMHDQVCFPGPLTTKEGVLIVAG